LPGVFRLHGNRSEHRRLTGEAQSQKEQRCRQIHRPAQRQDPATAIIAPPAAIRIIAQIFAGWVEPVFATTTSRRRR
jgi:hypothetical protein